MVDALLQFTSASLAKSRSTSPSSSRRLEAIIRGVQPDASCHTYSLSIVWISGGWGSST